MTLKSLRQEIDKVDAQLLKALEKRMDIVQRIGQFKQRQGMKPLDKDRWNKVLQEKLGKAKKHGLSEKFIRDIYERIHQESLRIQEEIKEKKS